MTSWTLAVSMYCWNLVSLPSLMFQTWQTCASMLLPVALGCRLEVSGEMNIHGRAAFETILAGTAVWSSV
jgi:hypothetical protein